MRARDFLEQIERNEVLIKNKLAEREYWFDMATSTTANMGGIRVKSSGNSYAMQNQTVEIALINEEIEKLKRDISYRISVIQRLKPNEYDLLHKVYVQHMSVKAVSVDAKKSYSWATSLHKKALDHLQKLLDEG